MSQEWKDDAPLWRALLASLMLHGVLLCAQKFSFPVPAKHAVEIDITNSSHLGMPGFSHAALQRPKPQSREWIKPTPQQKLTPALSPTLPTTPETPRSVPASEKAASEPAIGVGDSGENTLSRLPQVLNLGDLSAILRRLYPEDERAEGREGIVVMDLHLDTDGTVSAVDVVQSAGPDFDAAARRAAKFLQFTPAFRGSQPVAVKMRQAIQFKLGS